MLLKRGQQRRNDAAERCPDGADSHLARFIAHGCSHIIPDHEDLLRLRDDGTTSVRQSDRMPRSRHQGTAKLVLQGAYPLDNPALSSMLGATKAKPSRQPLPDHLPRHDVTHQATCACPVCGSSDFIRAGESVSEVLDYVPASFRVVRHIQPRFTCKRCDTQVRAEMPSLPIERSKPGAGLVAHVLIAKYCDHLPLYGQSEIYAREVAPAPIPRRRPIVAPIFGLPSAMALSRSTPHVV